MAGDWLKIEKATARKPEVMRLAALLGLPADQAFGMCFRFWAWCDDNVVSPENGDTGHASGMTLVLLDEVVSHPGFGEAVADVGWAQEEAGGLAIPNFNRHLSQSAKNRALEAEKKRKSRAKARQKSPECPPGTGTGAGPEKRREEYSTHALSAGAEASRECPPGTGTGVPTKGGENELRSGFPTKEEVVAYCKKQGWPVTEGVAFWCHYDSERSNGDRPIGKAWHWWSKLEKWMITAAATGGPAGRRNGSPKAKESRTSYEAPEDWDDENLNLKP